ncbi:MAG: DUF1080 domain-containing protein [Lentisphaeraceae bacterium]|nr:DUF1080 domain-containing protein [Lentisphaeraceae bacterium]
MLKLTVYRSICRRRRFCSIFNGKDLDGWTYKKTKNYNEENGYVVKEQQLIANGRCGNLYTNKRYKNYTLKFDFRFEPGKNANSGLGMRTEIDGSYPFRSRYEIQILDNHSPKYSKLKPYQYHGSIYGKVPAKKGFLKKSGEWNSQSVTVNANQVTITLNGEVIVDVDLSKYPDKFKIKEGHLCIAGHMDGISFKNLKLKELP